MSTTSSAKTAPIVTIIGCGYVGLTTAAIFANCGMKVYALEIDPTRLAIIRSGRSFFYEEGLDALVSAGLDSGRLIPTSNYEGSVSESDFVFSCVGTPDNADGSSNLTYVYEAARSAARLMKTDAIFVQKSTVPVGTGERVSAVLQQEAGRPCAYVSNPEFLREGTAIADTLWPDRVVTGGQDRDSARDVLALYELAEQRRDRLAAQLGLDAPSPLPATRYIATGLSSAELIKVTSNAFLALKISFTNSIAKLSDQCGADIGEVMDAVGADRRIGRAYLNANRGYGGGCFPKDVRSLISSAGDQGVAMEIMEAASDVNDSMPHYIIHKAEQALGMPLDGVNVAVLGLAFKPGTSDVRRSPGIAIANTLAGMGAHVSAYDPEAEESDELETSIRRQAGMHDALRGAVVVFITTDWPEFRSFGIDGLAGVSGAKLIVDCMNCLDRSALEWVPGTSYIGVGR